MKKNRWYEIDDIDEFVKSVRTLVVSTFYEDKPKCIFTDLFESKKNDIDKKLSLEEAYSIIRPLVKKNMSHQDEYLMSHKAFTEIVDSLNRRVISNLLTELASEGLVESAFSEEENDFIFWLKEST